MVKCGGEVQDSILGKPASPAPKGRVRRFLMARRAVPRKAEQRYQTQEEFMALSPQDRTAFVNAFTRVLINAWSSEEFAGRLDSDPRTALRESGLDIPADA